VISFAHWLVIPLLIGFVVGGSSIGYAQVDGAVQYPPRSVGEDAQPPPPARMVPQSVSPRRIELGVNGSSQLRNDYVHRAYPRSETDRVPAQGVRPPTAAGN
jgi:hypothetical protein